MFAALAFSGKEPRGIRRVWARHFGTKPEVEKTRLPGGGCFFELQVPACAKINWDAVFHTAGRLSSPMVLPAEVTPRQGCGVTRFIPEALPPRTVLATAQALLKTSGEKRVPVTVVDLRGILAREMEGIVQNSGNVRIVTSNMRAYTHTCEFMMERYGASVVVGAPGMGVPQGSLVVLPFGAEQAFSLSADSIALLPETAGEKQPGMLYAGPPVLPDEYALLRPGGIDAGVFAGALYELCAVKRFGRLPAGRLCWGETGVDMVFAAEKTAALLRKNA